MGVFSSMQIPLSTAADTSAASALPASGWTQAAIDWFLGSGIQAQSGGVARYYRIDRGEYLPVSTEITAYAAAFLCYLYRQTGRADCLQPALAAARYLTRTAWRPPLATIPFECDGVQEYAYFFDLGIITRALLALWRQTAESEFRDAAEACGRSMARDFNGPSGYHPVISLPGKQPVEGDGRWSRRPGCYQLKAALAWRELELATADPFFGRLWGDAVASLLPGHTTFLTSEPDRREVMNRLHAYCYFLEALLARASQPECAQALGEGLRLAGDLLREIRPEFERSDVCAQLLRVRLLAAAAGAVPLDALRAGEEAAALASFALVSDDSRVSGAIAFGRSGGRLMPFANPVSTAFAVQAAIMWDQWRAGAFRSGVTDLV